MYEKFTDRARKVMALANEEARRFQHEYIGTEHILLGIIEEGSGVAAHALKSVELDYQTIQAEVGRLVQPGANVVTKAQLPLTPRSNQVIVYAMEETRGLNHNYVGTEHLLLGLLREKEGVAAQALTNLGVQLEEMREDVLNILGHSVARKLGDPTISRKVTRPLPEKSADQSITSAPRITNESTRTASLVAVDIGNSQMKLGQFLCGMKDLSASESATSATVGNSLAEPIETLELPISHETGLFDSKLLAAWCEKHLSPDTHWLIGSVHRGAVDLLLGMIVAWSKQLGVDWPARRLTYKDIPFPIRVDEPDRVGIDRLLAAVAANHLRTPDRAAIVVDLGTAITVDLVEADGAFAGGAILPGIGMAGRALADQTDALPHVVLEHSATPPSPLGKSTKSAIEAGLYWGAVGAMGEIASRLAAQLPTQPDFFITGGAVRTVADSFEEKSRVRYVPHLVLSGIAILEQQAGDGQKSTG